MRLQCSWLLQPSGLLLQMSPQNATAHSLELTHLFSATSHRKSIVRVRHGALLCGMSIKRYLSHLFNHKQTHGDALPQYLDLVCAPMEKMYPAVGPEIESCCLLLQNILKRTKEGTKEEQTASNALATVSKVNAPHSSPSLLPANP